LYIDRGNPHHERGNHSMDMIVTFPGGKRVDAEYKGFTIHTDQPESSGGGNSAPSPFDLFLASIGTCAGIFVVSFLQERNLPTEEARVVMRTERNPETRLISRITLDIELPSSFPAKYSEAIKAAVNLCTVKKHLVSAPEFDLRVKIQ
jgi:putative redox protein